MITNFHLNGKLVSSNIQDKIAKSIDFINSVPEEGLEVQGNFITGNADEDVVLHKMSADTCSLVHRFANGCYIREILMPESSIVIGKIHKTEHFNIILEGSVTVITLEGKKRYDAPATFVSRAGIQKVVIMHTECRWQTVHVTDETDMPTIEAALVEESFDKLEAESLMKIAKRNLL